MKRLILTTALLLGFCGQAKSQTPSAPVIAPVAGSFNNSVTVSITDATPGVTIFFTTDGTTPTTLSPKYTTPFAVNATATVKAIAVLNSPNSVIASSAFTVVIPPPQPVCLNSGNVWNNSSPITASGIFQLDFDATPSIAKMDGIVGLSQGVATAYSATGPVIRFNNLNFVDVMNGANFYQSLAPFAYVPGTAYHFSMLVNLPVKTYSVSVNGTQIAKDYAFRPSQATLITLDTLDTYSEVGSIKVCSVVVGQPVQSPLVLVTTSLPAAKAGVLYSTILTAGGGKTPYVWTATGLPTGMTLTSAGLLSGVPTITGNFNVVVTDAASKTLAENLTLSVAPVVHKTSLSWTASASTGVTGYNVYRAGVKVGSVVGTTFVDSAIQAGSSYCYTVRTVASGESADSNQACVTVPTP